MKIFIALFVLVAFPAYSLAAFECDQHGLNQLEAVIKTLEKADGSLESESVFAKVYEMAKALSRSKSCQEMVKACSPALVGLPAYAYKKGSWDWKLAGPITDFSLTGDLTTTRGESKFVSTVSHDGFFRGTEERLVQTYNSVYALNLSDLSAADKMLACYRRYLK